MKTTQLQSPTIYRVVHWEKNYCSNEIYLTLVYKGLKGGSSWDLAFIVNGLDIYSVLMHWIIYFCLSWQPSHVNDWKQVWFYYSVTTVIPQPCFEHDEPGTGFFRMVEFSSVPLFYSITMVTKFYQRKSGKLFFSLLFCVIMLGIANTCGLWPRIKLGWSLFDLMWIRSRPVIIVLVFFDGTGFISIEGSTSRWVFCIRRHIKISFKNGRRYHNNKNLCRNEKVFFFGCFARCNSKAQIFKTIGSNHGKSWAIRHCPSTSTRGRTANGAPVPILQQRVDIILNVSWMKRPYLTSETILNKTTEC